MKTVADLKRRLVVGTSLTLTAHTCNGKETNHRYMNIPRVVSTVQTKRFACRPIDPALGTNESWQDSPKASELVIHDADKFTVDKGWVSCTYRIDSPKE